MCFSPRRSAALFGRSRRRTRVPHSGVAVAILMLLRVPSVWWNSSASSDPRVVLFRQIALAWSAAAGSLFVPLLLFLELSYGLDSRSTKPRMKGQGA